MAVFALLAAGVEAQFVVPEGSNYHNSSTLPLLDDGDDEAVLRKLQSAIREGSVGAALDALRLLRSKRDGRLVPFGPRTHVPSLERAAQIVATSSAEAIQAAVQDDANRAIVAARTARDINTLVDMATRGRALPTSQVAAAWAARLLFEEGHWWAASSMVALIDEPGPDLEELRARAIARSRPAGEVDAEASIEGDVFSWKWAIGVRQALDNEPDVGLPLVTRGRRDELLIVDATGLHGFDPIEQARTLESFRWSNELAEKLRERRFITSMPAPARFSMARSGSRIVVPFNTPIAISRARSPRERRRAHLVAIDLLERGVGDSTQQGAVLAWMTSPETSGGTAFGPPLVRGQRVFAQVFRAGAPTEVSLACFDLASGAELWDTPLVSGADVKRFANRQSRSTPSLVDKRAGTAELAELDGVIYACTGFGVVAAVDGWSGGMRHTFRYDRNFSLDPSTYHQAYLFDPQPGGWHEEPVRVWNGRLVVAPSDSRYLYMLAADLGPRGHLILDDPIERLDRVHIAGLLDDPSGGQSPAVVATQRRDGRLGVVVLKSDGHVIERSVSLAPQLSNLMGWDARPVVIGRSVLVPTSTGVQVFDLDGLQKPPRALTGSALGTTLPTGKLYVDGDMLVGISPEPRDAMLIQVWIRTSQ